MVNWRSGLAREAVRSGQLDSDDVDGTADSVRDASDTAAGDTYSRVPDAPTGGSSRRSRSRSEPTTETVSGETTVLDPTAAPDVRAPTPTERRNVAERFELETGALEPDDIGGVRFEDGQLEPVLTPEAREDIARDSFEASRPASETTTGGSPYSRVPDAAPAGREMDIDRFETDEVEFRAVEGGVEIEPTDAAVERVVADQLPGVDADEIAGVSPTDDGRTRVTVTGDARERLAREQFEQRQEQIGDGPDFDPRPPSRQARGEPTTVFDFDSSELDFEATDDGVDVSVRESAIEERREEELEEELEAGADFISALDVDETEEPGTTARVVDAFTDGFARVNPGTAAGLAAVGASLRTDSGLPIPGTGRTLPGQDDASGFRERLEGPRESIDAGIETAVETAAIGGDRGVGADDLPSIDIDTAADIGMRDPGMGAVATVAGTELGRDAATEGVTTGLQAFNPAGVAADTALFADAGVRGIDRTIQADADEVQTGFDTVEAVGEFAVDEGPTIAAAGVARDPGVLISAPVAGATIAAAGVIGGTAAVGGARVAGRAGRRVGDGATDVLSTSFGQIQRSTRRRRRDLTDIDVTLTRDPDAGLIDAPNIDMPSVSRPDISDVAEGVRDAARQSRIRPRPRRDERNIVDSISADLRFSAQEARSRVSRRLGRPMRDGWTPIQDIGADIRFDTQHVGLAVRDRLTPRPRRDERNVFRRLRGDLRFSATEARGRTSDLADDIGQTVREATTPDSAFLSDTRTRGTRPPTAGRFDDIDIGDAFGLDLSSGFLGDTRTGRVRPFVGAAGAGEDAVGAARGAGGRVRGAFDFDLDLSGGFLADDSTARARPFLAGIDSIDDATTSARGAVPSVPRSLDDIGIGGQGGIRDLTLRVETPRRRSIDVEDLDGPDPDAGAPMFREFDVDIDGADPAGPSPTASGRIDTDVDLGDGLVARRQQRTVAPEDATTAAARTQRRETLDRDTFGFAPFGAGLAPGVQDAADATGTPGTFETTTAADPALDIEAATEPAVGLDDESDSDTGTGTGTGTAVGTGLFGAADIGTVQGIDAIQTPQLATDTIAETTTSVPTVDRPRPPRRPPTIPSPTAPGPFDDDLPDTDAGFDDAVFETPTRTLDEADELVVDIGDMEVDP